MPNSEKLIDFTYNTYNSSTSTVTVSTGAGMYTYSVFKKPSVEEVIERVKSHEALLGKKYSHPIKSF